MEKVVINATKRTVIGKQVGVLRRAGKLPGVIYGHKMDPVAILMELKQSTRVLNTTTSSSVITVDLDGTEYAVLVREKQRDYLKNLFLHVDFQAVSQTEKIRAEVKIEFVGHAPAVKDFNGVVVDGITSVTVEALPKDLPERFIVDISNLMQIGDSITLRDIAIPNGVDVLDSLDEMIILITSPAAEEVEEVTEETAEEPEVIEKGKKEEEEEAE
ncbi:MAG: 50S ribosomal protein L25 [Chloroflexi bacterium]|nr:MAG: 50S ribosomal protein L25 [Chloroflexota bacterium]